MSVAISHAKMKRDRAVSERLNIDYWINLSNYAVDRLAEIVTDGGDVGESITYRHLNDISAISHKLTAIDGDICVTASQISKQLIRYKS